MIAAPPLPEIGRYVICRTREEAAEITPGTTDYEGRPVYGVTAKAARFLRAPQRRRAFVGGVGSGKTWAGIDASLIESGRRRCRGMIVSPTYGNLRDVIIDDFRMRAGGLLLDFKRADMEFHMLNGSVILLRTAERPDLLRGPSLAWVWGDEAALWEEYVHQMVLARLRQAGPLWLTTTPRGKRHWLFKKFALQGDETPEQIRQHNEKFFLVHAATRENIFLPEEYIEDLRSDYGTGWFSRQELEGEFTEPEGALFHREWFRVLDMPPHDKEIEQVVRGWDLACTTQTYSDYTVGCKIARMKDGRFVILDIYHGKWEWPDARKQIIDCALRDGPNVHVGIETVAFQTVAKQELLREPSMHGYLIKGVERTGRGGDKVAHAAPLASRVEAGLVSIVRGRWNDSFLDELCSWTGDKKEPDDQVDAAANAYALLAKKRYVSSGQKHWN